MELWEEEKGKEHALTQAVGAAMAVLDKGFPGAHLSTDAYARHMAIAMINALTGDVPGTGNRFTEAVTSMREPLAPIARRMKDNLEEEKKDHPWLEAHSTEIAEERPAAKASSMPTELLPQMLTQVYGEKIAADLMQLGDQMRARADRESNPVELMYSAHYAVRDWIKYVMEDRGLSGSEAHQLLDEILEHRLEPYLVPDWRRVGQARRSSKDDTDDAPIFSRAIVEAQMDALKKYRGRA